jgi:surfeit locus 1 family protein
VSSVKKNWAVIILYVLGLSLLLSLSLWQYKRGVEKQEIAEMSALTGTEIVSSAPGDWSKYIYQDNTLAGQWADPRTFILENRIYRQRVGFEVLTPFKLLADNTWVLVNRGWVATAEEATSTAVSGSSRLAGVLYLPEKGVALGDSILPEALISDQWPKKSLYIDIPVFSKALGIELAPAMLVLNEADPSSSTGTVPSARSRLNVPSQVMRSGPPLKFTGFGRLSNTSSFLMSPCFTPSICRPW